jgi:hypothetical protein
MRGRMLGMCYIICMSSSHDTYLEKHVMYFGGFSAHGFFDGFLFMVE